MTYLIIKSEIILKPELAISNSEQEIGLMNRNDLPEVMAFLYPGERINHFWMKNTPQPLDIVFCYKDKISEIHYGEPHSLKIIGSNKFSDLVLEFPHKTCEKYNINIGDDVKLFLNKQDVEKYNNLFAFRRG